MDEGCPSTGKLGTGGGHRGGFHVSRVTPKDGWATLEWLCSGISAEPVSGIHGKASFCSGFQQMQGFCRSS